MVSPIRAVLFDLDGVLVDAGEWHYTALNRALALFGYAIPAEEHDLVYNGLPTRQKLELLSRRRGFPRALHGFVDELKQSYTREILDERLAPDAGKSALLAALKGMGLKLGLASNSRRETVDKVLDAMDLRHWFDVVLSHEDVERPKPDPQVFLRCAELLGCAPESCLIVEDSPPGVQAARGASPHVLTVAGPHEVTKERLLAALARGGTETGSRNEGKLLPGRLEIVIPMAGQGRRFAERGYDVPKPLVPIFGKPMIAWVVENLRPRLQRYRFTFLCSQSHLRDYPVEKLLLSLEPEARIVAVPGDTQGAACTVLLAADAIEPSQPLLIANSDQWLQCEIDPFLYRASTSGCDGLIMTFEADDPKWSYARTDVSGRVTEVAEKRPISPHATVGLYHFRSGDLFLSAAREMIRRDERVNGEFYVCPVYNGLIRDGKDVRIFQVPPGAMHGLGTPEDLETFVRWTLASPHRSRELIPQEPTGRCES